MAKQHYIRLYNAVFYAYHGNHHEERRLGGKFHVDVEMETDFTEAAETDDLSKAVNYADIYDLIHESLMNEKFNLIETVAKKIADSVLAAWPMVTRVSVKVRKPGAPIKGVIDYVEAQVDECR